MTQVKHGDTVRVNYTGKLGDGTAFDSSKARGPLEFTVGEGRILPGLEHAVTGMKPGDTKMVVIGAEEAFGQRREDLVVVVDRNELPSHLDPKVGDRLEMRQPEGKSMVLNVTEITDESVTLDGNHPLAGEDLTFDLELVEIV